jgi:hypothetical protein
VSGANGNGAGGPGGSISLALAVVDALDDAGLELLAERLRPWLPEQAPADAGGWLNPSKAAEYLSLKVRRIYDLKSMGALEPDGYDGRTPLWRRETLDAYVRSQRT